MLNIYFKILIFILPLCIEICTCLLFLVTLYKCDVGRPDCSRCLSNLITMPEFGCGWCQSDGICSVQDSPACKSGWIPPSIRVNCPNPVLVAVSD